jgi:hypothetical protein
MGRKYKNEDFELDNDKLETFIEENEIGQQYRHFKLIEADKKECNIGYVKIGSSGSPLSAAKKLFKSLCHFKNMNGKNKLKVKSTFTIQETTHDSKKKIYGPYQGEWKLLTEKEKELANRSGINFSMRSIVKLVQKQKGGKRKNKKEEDNHEKNEENTEHTEDNENNLHFIDIESLKKVGG